jgi:hypothetical protein
MDECLDRVGDLEVQIAWVKSDRGRVPVDVVFGVDGGLARTLGEESKAVELNGHGHAHDHGKSHQSEVEVLSITLSSPSPNAVIDASKLEKLLKSAPKDEVYRIKAVLAASSPIASSEDAPSSSTECVAGRYILNWAFGRWTFTPMDAVVGEHESSSGVVLRMTMILARFESKKWKKRLETQGFVELEGAEKGVLSVEKIA